MESRDAAQSVDASPGRALTAEDILLHPDFERAKSAHLRSLTQFFLENRSTAQLMVDAGTITLRALLVGFHANHRPDDPDTWATVGRVQDIIAKRGLASRRRVDALIGRFRQIGYIDCEDCPADRRVRVLRPMRRLLDHDRAHLLAYHRFLHELYPDRGYDWRDEDTHLAIRRTAFHHLDRAMTFMNHSPFMMFLARDAGYLAFLLVAEAEFQGRAEQTSFSALAARLGVSRTHVRGLFVEAERAGLIDLGDSRKRAVRILPSLWQAYDRFLADIHAGQDAIAQAAFRSRRQTGSLKVTIATSPSVALS